MRTPSISNGNRGKMRYTEKDGMTRNGRRVGEDRRLEWKESLWEGLRYTGRDGRARR